MPQRKSETGNEKPEVDLVGGCRTIKLRSYTPTKPTSSFSFPVSDLLYGIILILFFKKKLELNYLLD